MLTRGLFLAIPYHPWRFFVKHLSFLTAPVLMLLFSVCLVLACGGPGGAAESAGQEVQSALIAPAAEPAAKGAASPSVPSDETRLQAAIASAIADGKVDTFRPAGFLGIPGGPEVNPVMAFAWAIWVGWIFSTVGAFGGVMASVGHISIFGLGDYGSSFGKGTPMNKLVTDSIRVSN